MRSPRILLADAQMILLEGLQLLLAGKYEVISMVTNGTDLVQVARKHKPDVIVTDMGLPGLSGLDAVIQLQREQMHARVIFLTSLADMDTVSRGFRSGSVGYVLKLSPCSELILAIEEVLAGRMYITPRIAKDIVDVFLHAASPYDATPRAPTASLTKRQVEVMRLVAQGKTMKEVASDLGISTRTAEAHKYQMMEHLGMRTVPELIQKGIAMGIVELSASRLSAL